MTGEDATQASGLPAGIGAALKAARLAQGYSLFALAHELNLSVQILEAVEEEDWERIPAGRERPHTRQIAERLGVDLGTFPEQWRQLPGALEQEPRDPRQEAMERILMSALTVGSVGLLLWLVVPGRSLRRDPKAAPAGEVRAGPAPWVPKDPVGSFPVLGEVLPEAPVTEEGVLVSMRAMDICEASIQGPDPKEPPKLRSLRVSEPWHLRVKGPFTITLNNAGVVVLEVAGRRIRHGRNVGEAWSGAFDETGTWAIPEPTLPKNAPAASELPEAVPEVE
jgi:transcriptional regulator with XRE-family HTH domain